MKLRILAPSFRTWIPNIQWEQSFFYPKGFRTFVSHVISVTHSCAIFFPPFYKTFHINLLCTFETFSSPFTLVGWGKVLIALNLARPNCSHSTCSSFIWCVKWIQRVRPPWDFEPSSNSQCEIPFFFLFFFYIPSRMQPLRWDPYWLEPFTSSLSVNAWGHTPQHLNIHQGMWFTGCSQPNGRTFSLQFGHLNGLFSNVHNNQCKRGKFRPVSFKPIPAAVDCSLLQLHVRFYNTASVQWLHKPWTFFFFVLCPAIIKVLHSYFLPKRWTAQKLKSWTLSPPLHSFLILAGNIFSSIF